MAAVARLLCLLFMLPLIAGVPVQDVNSEFQILNRIS